MDFYLRDIKLTDTEDIHNYASLDAVSKFQGWGPNTLKDTEDHVKFVLKREATHYHKVIVDEQSGKVIGAIEMTIDKSNESGEIGYILHPDFWGKGIMTKTVGQIIDYGFNQLNLNRIWATTDTENIGSEKVMQKTGMIKEGLLRQDIKLKHGFRDSLIYSILSNEYKFQ